MKKKLYIETSVWNQIMHTDRPDWKRATQEFFNTIKTGVYEIFVSELVLDEIAQASNQVLREQLRKQISELQPIMLDFNTEARALVDQYRAAAIIKSDKPKILVDLGHVAIATVNGVRHIISFNFDHLVNEIKIDKFNSVNLNVGYDVIVDIKTPESYIIRNEEEDV